MPGNLVTWLLGRIAPSALLYVLLALLVTQSLSAAYIVHLLKEQGAAEAKCQVTQLEQTAAHNEVANDLQEGSLRDEIATLKSRLVTQNEIAKRAEAERKSAEQLLNDARKRLNDAVTKDPSLAAAIDPAITGRLRAFEAAYRIRTEGSH